MATEKDYRVCRGCKQGSIGREVQSGFPEERLVILDQVKRWQLHGHGPHWGKGMVVISRCNRKPVCLEHWVWGRCHSVHTPVGWWSRCCFLDLCRCCLTHPLLADSFSERPSITQRVCYWSSTCRGFQDSRWLYFYCFKDWLLPLLLDLISGFHSWSKHLLSMLLGLTLLVLPSGVRRHDREA